jgi:hypothetical protein
MTNSGGESRSAISIESLERNIPAGFLERYRHARGTAHSIAGSPQKIQTEADKLVSGVRSALEQILYQPPDDSLCRLFWALTDGFSGVRWSLERDRAPKKNVVGAFKNAAEQLAGLVQDADVGSDLASVAKMIGRCAGGPEPLLRAAKIIVNDGALVLDDVVRTQVDHRDPYRAGFWDLVGASYDLERMRSAREPPDPHAIWTLGEGAQALAGLLEPSVTWDAPGPKEVLDKVCARALGTAAGLVFGSNRDRAPVVALGGEIRGRPERYALEIPAAGPGDAVTIGEAALLSPLPARGESAVSAGWWHAGVKISDEHVAESLEVAALRSIIDRASRISELQGVWMFVPLDGNDGRTRRAAAREAGLDFRSYRTLSIAIYAIDRLDITTPTLDGYADLAAPSATARIIPLASAGRRRTGRKA